MRWVLASALLLVSCSKGPESDLPYVKQARSLGAEWALVNEQATRGTLSRTYVSSMHRWLRKQLQIASTSLTQPSAPYAAEIHALLRQADDAPPVAFRAHVDKLKQIEDELESA